MTIPRKGVDIPAGHVGPPSPLPARAGRGAAQGAYTFSIGRRDDGRTGMSDQTTTRLIQAHLDRLHAGDAGARDGLIGVACERLRRLTRRMLGDFPGVRRWEETDDVLSEAVLRLCRALED